MIQSPSLPPVTVNLGEDQRWKTIQRMVESPHFSKSPRLSRLLLYLAEQTLLERSDLLSEQVIAVRVFERDGTFNPAVDTIVRSHMVRLRQKLERYAEEEGAAPIRVSIPKGEYVVRFDAVTMPRLEAEPNGVADAAPVPRVAAAPAKSFRITAYVLGILLLVSWGLGFVLLRHRAQTAAQVQAQHPLWSRIFQPGQHTTFVAADSGLVLLHRMTAESTTLDEYLARDFSKVTHGLSPERRAEVLDMANRRYTSFVDLNLFRGLERVAGASTGLEPRYARDLHIDDLKHGNFIFSGSRGANPWLELYETGMNFVGSTRREGAHHIYTFTNRHPAHGELAEYSVTEEGANRRIVGVLAFLSNLNHDGNVLIVEGDSMAGTEAISDFLLDDSSLLPFLAKLKKADGSLPHFEVLVESNSINGSAGPFHILAYRTYP